MKYDIQFTNQFKKNFDILGNLRPYFSTAFLNSYNKK